MVMNAHVAQVVHPACLAHPTVHPACLAQVVQQAVHHPVQVQAVQVILQAVVSQAAVHQ